MKELLLKKLRQQKGMSQEWIAQETHVVRQTVSKWEKGLVSPRAEDLLRLSSLLDVSLNQLFGINDDLSNEQYPVSWTSEHAHSHKDNSPTTVKKEEMIACITNRLEEMNETGVTALYDLIMIIPVKERWLASTSKEHIAELDAIAAQCEQETAQEKERAAKEAKQRTAAKREQLYHDYARMFNAIKNVEIPARYDLMVDEIKAIDIVCGEASRCFPEYAFSVACKYFKYGFIKGQRYATARAKKKKR